MNTLEQIKTVAAMQSSNPHYHIKKSMAPTIANMLARLASSVKGHACFVQTTFIGGTELLSICKIGLTPIDVGLVYLTITIPEDQRQAIIDKVIEQGERANAHFRSFQILAVMNLDWKIKLQDAANDEVRKVIKDFAAEAGLTVIEPAASQTLD